MDLSVDGFACDLGRVFAVDAKVKCHVERHILDLEFCAIVCRPFVKAVADVLDKSHGVLLSGVTCLFALLLVYHLAMLRRSTTDINAQVHCIICMALFMEKLRFVRRLQEMIVKHKKTPHLIPGAAFCDKS